MPRNAKAAVKTAAQTIGPAIACLIAFSLGLSSCSSHKRPAFAKGITIEKIEKKPNASVYDLSWEAPRAAWKTSRAYAVLPAAQAPGPGILYFHQLGRNRNRSQFLAEALSLADRGVRSVLIDGNAPWSEQWKGTVEDVQMIDAQMIDLDTCIGILKALPGIDPERLGFIGHDYGAMFGALLYGKESPLKAFALIAPAPEFADWISYFNRHAAEDKAGYSKLLEDRNPLTALKRDKGVPLLLQFATNDSFIPEARAQTLAAVAPGATVQTIEKSSHNGISDDAASQRLAWILPILGLKP
jgi:dienelactone hydrolase